MEKRVFSLYGRSDLFWDVANRAFYMAVALGFVYMSWRDPVWRWGWLVMVALAVFLAWYTYVSRRNARLEISDEGLFVMSRRRLGYRLRWDAITSCSVTPAARSLDVPFLQAVVTDSHRHRVAISGWCPDAAEILEILKQHLPETVFVSR